MTIRAMVLLKKLKKAQINPDRQVYIDFEKMEIETVRDAKQSYKTVSIKKFCNSVFSTLDYLSGLGYIDYDNFNGAKVTHLGWHAFGATVQDAVKFTVRDVIVPIIVTIITTIVLRYI